MKIYIGHGRGLPLGTASNAINAKTLFISVVDFFLLFFQYFDCSSKRGTKGSENQLKLTGDQ
jgi:hypothetical protein